MEYKIVEKDTPFSVHSVGYFGDRGKQKAQERIDSGYCLRHWINRSAKFIVIPAR